MWAGDAVVGSGGWGREMPIEALWVDQVQQKQSCSAVHISESRVLGKVNEER